MEDLEFPENDIEWNDLFTEVFDSSSAETFSNPSPDDSVSNWVTEIENMLFKDDDVDFEPSQPLLDDFFSDILVDSPCSSNLESNQQLLENFFSDVPVDSSGFGDATAAAAAAAIDKNPNVSDESAPVSSEEEKAASEGPEVNTNNEDNKNDNIDNDESCNNDDDDADDPVSKKRRRQLRNRDAAVRSRERKKTYVKDLEMKSRYLEGECRRLGRLLQCVVAENQALHFSVQKGNALGASLAKQESAVLLMESLLLGSLLWFLGIMCLFTLPPLTLLNLESVPLVQVEEKAPPGNLAQRGAGSNHLTLLGLNSRRCKASRTKMKFISHALRA
ncbi:hypothetical protein Dsin_003992 [Dipteronia sinensis]|uniref:BZIP domain-containing protein n=1 Tax=Dipteronia sinensis TaxID=43782 RepID=A0AAE0B946_9ROSI|nr:hypothetical protein Dsin_003992 [Dipteronia sinensis]